MATSSIFTSFTITDRATAEKFAKALETASKQPKWKPSMPVEAPERDPGNIRETGRKGQAECQNIKHTESWILSTWSEKQQ
ncbi:MAG: hypothetical protein LUF30_05610 [Lachnospiraceae bacterium]|nr:hypothetical protein [Lachnospiraceae bacterium]